MLNEQASAFFAERIKKVRSMPANQLAGTENELGAAWGLIAYAFFCGDITYEEHKLLNLHITEARNDVVRRLCAEPLARCA